LQLSTSRTVGAACNGGELLVQRDERSAQFVRQPEIGSVAFVISSSKSDGALRSSPSRRAATSAA
jgi:hypothetical protein